MLFSGYIFICCISVLLLWSPAAASPQQSERIASPPGKADGAGQVVAPDSVKHTVLKGQHSIAPRKPRLGIVLSGGGARGLAQVGVLKALEEEGIRPDLIVGVSIGSIVGGLYAAGYNADRLERAVRELDWKHLLRLSDEADRSYLAVDQKPMADRSILTLHLDGLQPMLPMAASNGQRLLNALNGLVLQGLYHSNDFDSLGIPFRAIATDLHSGKRVVLCDGNLAEALRASSAIPVMYSPIVRDGMLLVDGGLLSNIPIDVAREAGCDIVVAINTTSPLRSPEQLTNALETLDQVFNVMMARQASEMSELADLLIVPELSDLSATDFSSPDSLIGVGYLAGREAMAAVKRLLNEWTLNEQARNRQTSMNALQHASGNHAGSPSRDVSSDPADPATHALPDDESLSPSFAEAAVNTRGDADIAAPPAEHMSEIRIHGASLLSEAVLAGIEGRWKRQPLNTDNVRNLREYILEEYRMRGYSLAHIRSMDVDPLTGAVVAHIEEGRIHDIRVVGNERTNSVVILREIPVSVGEVFRIEELERGMRNLAALPLFHSVSFDIENVEKAPVITIRVVERTSQMLQAGVLVDNERNAQLGLLLRDASFLGTGTELRAAFFSGARNRRYAAEYHTNRLFYTPFSFTTEGFWGFRDFNAYEDVEGLPMNRFEREATSVYRAIGYGTQAAVGLYVERFGTIQGRMRYEQQSIRTTEFRNREVEGISENHLLVSLGVSATMDTQDRYPFPRKGVYFHSDYTSAQRILGGDLAFSRLMVSYDFYLPLYGENFVLHPRFLFGYGDKTMPTYEEFRLGGLSSFIGMRENEFNGRQVAVGSLELRYQLPFDILFDSYFSLRYDLGRTWANPELVRLGDLRHGAGMILGLDTPIGPANFGIGRSFYPVRNNPETPVRVGPTRLYFSIGVALD